MNFYSFSTDVLFSDKWPKGFMYSLYLHAPSTTPCSLMWAEHLCLAESWNEIKVSSFGHGCHVVWLRLVCRFFWSYSCSALILLHSSTVRLNQSSVTGCFICKSKSLSKLLSKSILKEQILSHTFSLGFWMLMIFEPFHQRHLQWDSEKKPKLKEIFIIFTIGNHFYFAHRALISCLYPVYVISVGHDIWWSQRKNDTYTCKVGGSAARRYEQFPNGFYA